MRPLASFSSTRSASAPISFDTRSTVAFCSSSVPARAVGRRGLCRYPRGTQRVPVGYPTGYPRGTQRVPEGREHTDHAAVKRLAWSTRVRHTTAEWNHSAQHLASRARRQSGAAPCRALRATCRPACEKETLRCEHAVATHAHTWIIPTHARTHARTHANDGRAPTRSPTRSHTNSAPRTARGSDARRCGRTRRARRSAPCCARPGCSTHRVLSGTHGYSLTGYQGGRTRRARCSAPCCARPGCTRPRASSRRRTSS